MRKLQQGDVILNEVPCVPTAAQKRDSCVLAEGKATGHHHVVVGDDVEVFEADGVLYLHVPDSAVIEHKEHRRIEVPAGDYRVQKVREYDHFAEEAREVRD